MNLAKEELSSDWAIARGGPDYRVSAPRMAGAQAADGACIYAQVYSTLLGLHPEGKQPYNGKTYTLDELLKRSDEVYEQTMQLMQGVKFMGVSGSPFSFDCPGLPKDGSPCNHTCRNSATCTGDGLGSMKILQFKYLIDGVV